MNLPKQCKEEFNVSVWRCPTFLFTLMGVVVIFSILIAYFIANNYGQDPEITALLVLFTAAFTFTIGHIIIRSFATVIEASRLKSQFLNIASHQLLTPLTALKWSMCALGTDNVSSDIKKQKEMLFIIQENTNKMINLVNGLLDVGRMENGAIRLNPEKVDMVKTVNDIVASKADELAKKKNRIEIVNEKEAMWARADLVRLKIAMESLIDNAIQYSRYNDVISLALKTEGDKIIFEIADKGIGIPARELKHIFGKFFRAGNASVYQQKGLGLGLFLTKFIIEASGGEIDFESKEGVGSKFWFSLPTAN